MGKLGTRHELKPLEDLEDFNALTFADDLVIASGTVHGKAWLLTKSPGILQGMLHAN